MALFTVAEVRAQITTAISDTDLANLIDREEAMLVRKFGPHGDGVTPLTEVLEPSGGDLFLSRPFVSITSIGGAVSTATNYPKQGRVKGCFSGDVTVVYVPVDDRPERQAVLLELLRQALEQTAMKSESIAGEYSFQAPDWEAQRAALYRRLRFATI